MAWNGSKMRGNAAQRLAVFPVCNIDDIISSKKAANRPKDSETLPRLMRLSEWLKKL